MSPLEKPVNISIASAKRAPRQKKLGSPGQEKPFADLPINDLWKMAVITERKIANHIHFTIMFASETIRSPPTAPISKHPGFCPRCFHHDLLPQTVHDIQFTFLSLPCFRSRSHAHVYGCDSFITRGVLSITWNAWPLYSTRGCLNFAARPWGAQYVGAY